MKRNYPLSRKSNVVVQELDGEVLIYDLNNNKAFCLNETSALVWQMCDGSKSITEISESVGKKFDASASEDLVWLALDQLKKEKLIENAAELENPFQGMNRREVIKKIGLGTMIALPIVASMVAPSPINAASNSCTNTGTSCNCTAADRSPNGNCTSTTCTPNNTASMTTPLCICLGSNPAGMNGACGVGVTN